MKRSFLALFLVLVMVVGMIPVTVSAAGDNSVTFLDESGNTIESIEFDGTTTIATLLNGEAAEAASVRTAIAKTETKVFAGWTSADGATAVDDSAEITQSLTVKANFSAYKLYTAADLISEDDAGRLVPKNSKASLAAIEENGEEYYVVRPNNNMEGRAVWLYWTFDTNDVFATSDVEAVVTKFKSNTQDRTSPTSVGLVPVDSSLGFGDKNRLVISCGFPSEAGADGVYDVSAVFEIPEDYTSETINGLGIGPWGGEKLPVLDTEAGESYTNYYAAYEYVAIFEKASAVKYFEEKTTPEGEEPEEEDDTVDLVDCHVFEADEFTASAAGYFADGLTTVDGVEYFRFTGPEEEYEYTRSYYGTLGVPEDVPAHKYHYAVIGYRTNITDTASVSVGLLPKDGTAYKRFWGLNGDLNGSNGAIVVDIAEINAGDADITTFDESIDESSNVKYLRVGPHKTYGSTQVANEYFDVEYIGFFKNKASADAYAESRIPEVLPELNGY